MIYLHHFPLDVVYDPVSEFIDSFDDKLFVFGLILLIVAIIAITIVLVKKGK